MKIKPSVAAIILVILIMLMLTFFASYMKKDKKDIEVSPKTTIEEPVDKEAEEKRIQEEKQREIIRDRIEKMSRPNKVNINDDFVEKEVTQEEIKNSVEETRQELESEKQNKTEEELKDEKQSILDVINNK